MLYGWTVRLLPILLLATTTRAQQWTRFRGPNGQGPADAQAIASEWKSSDYAWRATLPGEGLSSPVVWADKVFVTSCHESGPVGLVLALDAGTGDILWQKTYALTKYMMNSSNSYAASTPAVDAERVYVLWPTADELTAVALDHEGHEAWTKDFGSIRSNHGPCVSPMLY
ncbi:MAG: PQQ-binding-like beta-propeller repeat protein, partial [Sedimentisphaerales bacterium]|nr:PQQ-binding-like beta-propeller repeat protein [Sedimentisphaerales bacterium]